MYMIWASLGCLILGVNSIVWKDNVINWAPVWCDISSRYIVGANVGIPASSLCIIRRLYYITKAQSLSQDRQDRRREIIIDICIGIGLPCIIMALQYVVQGHRFDIFEQVGCWPATYDTLPAYFLIFMWPVVIGMISIVYAVLTFRQAYIHRKRLRAMLESSYDISTGRYCRLMALCMAEITFTVTLGIYSLVLNIGAHINPYISWDNVHFDFSRVGQFPSVVWQSVPVTAVSLEFSRWCYILCAFVIFGFFGWGKEARESYQRALQVIVRCTGMKFTQSMARKSAGNRYARLLLRRRKQMLIR
ncbi:hypothetical protein ID866_9278 [Astraeus odoratus]|nr:hypothetical protein ID866_9278 [Astraeus odoratus]